MYIEELMMIAIGLSFYCDADQYLPIRFFEAWMNYITNTTNRNDPEFQEC